MFSAMDMILITGITFFSIVGVIFTLNYFVDCLQKDLAIDLRKDIDEIK